MAEGIDPPIKIRPVRILLSSFFLAKKLDRAVREANHSMPSVLAAARMVARRVRLGSQDGGARDRVARNRGR
jgi:hypothetical protein